jgi:hypothetical protein
MLPHIIDEAHNRGMVAMGGDEMYRWWTFRRKCYIESDGEHPRLLTPSDEFNAELEVFPAWDRG